MNPFKNLIVEINPPIARVTINRPGAMNALNQDVTTELIECFGESLVDHAIGCVIITGAGDKAFVAGADIRQLAKLDEAAGKTLAEQSQAMMQAVQDLPVPVIAAINGFALGGGCELALACDIRLAASTARIGQPEVNLGLIPGFGGTQRLPRLVGRGKALQLILTGDMISAGEALRIGLVDEVHPPEELNARATDMAEKISSRGPLAVRFAKRAIHRGLDLSLEQGLALEAEFFGRLFDTEDQKEGTAAFLEKRPPRFKGK